MKFPAITRALRHLESCLYPVTFTWDPEQRHYASDALKEARDEIAVVQPSHASKWWETLWGSLCAINPIWFNDEKEGVNLILACLRSSARGVVPLTTKEIELLSCMVWGVPVSMDDHTTTQIIVPVIRQYERLLAAGLRPQDPAAPDADPRIDGLSVMHNVASDGFSFPAERAEDPAAAVLAEADEMAKGEPSLLAAALALAEVDRLLDELAGGWRRGGYPAPRNDKRLAAIRRLVQS